ncbi:MAG: aspartate/glutamate racemase family protein [Geminicoccaceae bacterium]
MTVTGGKSIYEASVGILMLDARFPRIPGDMGNAATWPFPVLYRIVRGASPDLVVRHRAEGLLDAFIETGRDLIRDGAAGITTNCGFLSLYQQELATALKVPVATSSLMQVPMVQALLPEDKRVGVLTISKASLSKDHLSAIGLPEDLPIEGTDDGQEFSRVILGDELELDVDQARTDNVNAALRLMANHPDVGAIVLECTNMGPYAADIRAATCLPVFDMVSFVTWFRAGLNPARYWPPQ